jgi:hypothetical protein
MMQPADGSKRWDTDDRHEGVADASSFAAWIEELAILARRARWIAEDPQAHLVPQLRDASSQLGNDGLRMLRASTDQDGVLTAAFEHPLGASRRDIRRLAWALIGAVAETMASVRERHHGHHVVFDVVTGEPEGTGPFASHGHTVRLILQPPDTESG